MIGILEDGNKPWGALQPPLSHLLIPCIPGPAMNNESLLRDKPGVLCTLPLRLARRDHEVQMAAAVLGVRTFSDE